MKVIAIAAVTAGGKTTIVNGIKGQLSSVQTLHFDDYVIPLPIVMSKSGSI